MNRLKLWVFALLVAVAAAFGLREHATRLRAQAIEGLDARLAVAAAHVEATSRSHAREAAMAAAFASRDDRLIEALHQKEAAPPPARGRRRRAAPPRRTGVDEEAQEVALREAARAALASAEKVFGFELPDGTVVTAGNREWLARKGAPSDAEGEAMASLRRAIGGETSRGYVRLNGALFHAASSPAGPEAALVVLVPVDETWAKGVATAARVDLTLSVPDVKSVSTVRGADAQALASGAKVSGVTQDIGRVTKVDIAIGPVAIPGLPLLLGAAPSRRARAVAFEGVKGGLAIVSLPAAPVLASVATFEWYALATLAVFLVVAFILGFFVRSHEAQAAVPESLLAAAARIERGDFSARVPALAGKLGTVATALNRAAELAGPAAAAETAKPSVTDEFFAGGAVAQGQPPVAKPPAPAIIADGPFEAVLAPPRPPAPPLPLPRSDAPAPPASPAGEVDEETHWKQVFQDFLRTRATCGEPSEGLTYEKFRLKLEGNKAALVSKYACRTVKFQVYVKDGKAALKASPVK